MNGLERILTAVAFKPTDRIPAIPLIFGHAATLANLPLNVYLRSGALLAKSQISAQARYGSDAVYAFMDTFVETEAIGSTLHYPANRYPQIETHALKPGDDPFRLGFPDPEKDGRMPEVLKAASLLRAEVGERLLIVGALLGPMSLATTLMDMEEALYFAADHPNEFERLLDYAADVAIRYGIAQIHAGVHVPVLLDPSATGSLIPAAFFREFILPRHRRIFAAFQQEGTPCWVYISGPTRSILPYFSKEKIDIVSFDYEVSSSDAQRSLPRTCLSGNIKTIDLVLNSKEQIYRDASALCDAFAERGGFLLSTGSEVPPEAKLENIDAMIAACGKA